ncbi:MAG TPA: ChbG/HpnK family deacetylase [Acidimicrobiales bacterium]|nr:ChbG/HpnK family deacetylase [Acidimicrobiales bacterium]
MPDLVARLGYPAGTSLLILTADDLGSSHAANVGVYQALRDGMATSASLMVPGPWARDAASRYRGEDIGVHLTVNAEYDLVRWGPITVAPSLLDGDGGFPRTVDDVAEHADIDELRRECRAQLERAVYWGFDVSHLSSHLGAMERRPELFDVLLELSIDFGLPLRLPDAALEADFGFPFRALAGDEGVLSPDRLVRVPVPLGAKKVRGAARRAVERALFELAPGVTELCFRPALDAGELRAMAPDWPARVDDLDLLIADSSLPSLATRAGAVLIGYRALRDLQRSR